MFEGGSKRSLARVRECLFVWGTQGIRNRIFRTSLRERFFGPFLVATRKGLDNSIGDACRNAFKNK